MASVVYDVEVIRQEANPICWVASCAMVKGYKTASSVGVGDFIGGFDPSNSCIANLAGSWSQCTDMMNTWGFDVFAVGDLSSGSMAAADLLGALARGPAVLLHMCAGFPYGSQHAGMTFGPGDAHAVVLTGIDSDTNSATFNNPWGDKDQPCDLGALLAKINADQAQGRTIGFWRS
jgi:hypothetical protein